MAEQAAPGLLEKIREPATKAADYITGDKVSPVQTVGFIASKLRDLVPNVINGLRPTNVANAVRATNLQGAADRTLENVAARPYVTGYGVLARDWRSEKRREAREQEQAAAPAPFAARFDAQGVQQPSTGDIASSFRTAIYPRRPPTFTPTGN
jgi:hypothetical protein